MKLGYNIDKIKFATDKPTFEKAIDLYKKGKVTQVEERFGGFSALVVGTKQYNVSVENRRFGYGSCSCYLGENGTLCKHIVALAIYLVKNGKPLTSEDEEIIEGPKSSGLLGTLTGKELLAVKESINEAAHYIKPYKGPSRTWFAYQDSLQEGCRRLSAIVTGLPVNFLTTSLVVELLLRLDRKLQSGVDDSDGTVGGFIEEAVVVLQEYAKLNPDCLKAFNKLQNKETVFGWEKPLFDLIRP